MFFCDDIGWIQEVRKVDFYVCCIEYIEREMEMRYTPRNWIVDLVF